MAPALISALLVLCWLLPLEPWFRYEREAIGQGQLWRLLSGNLVHIDGWHLLSNLVGLWLVHWWVADSLSEVRWWVTSVLCGLGVTAGLYLWHPDIAWYMGFSGALYGVFAAGSVFMLPRHRYLALTGLVLVVMKLIADEVGFLDLGVSSISDVTVIHQAHNYGFAVGALVALVWSRFSGRSGSGSPPAGS